MCRTVAAPMAAAVTMAGTAAGLALAVLRERFDRRQIEEEAREEVDAADADDEKSGKGDSP